MRVSSEHRIRLPALPVLCAVLSSFAFLPSAAPDDGRLVLIERLESRPAAAETRFRTLENTGVEHVVPIDIRHPLKRLYTNAFACGGIGIADFDGNGRPDLFFADGPGPNRLYLQTGDLQFRETTQEAGVAGGDAWGAGVAVIDIDADRDPDIYVCNYESPNQLFINDGQGRFTERARDFGLDRQGAWLMAYFSDYDRDGDLDVYLLGHRFYRQGGRPSRAPSLIKDGQPTILPEYARYYQVTQRGNNRYEVNNCGAPDQLLRNDSEGEIPRFTDVTGNVGLEPGRWQGNSALWFDYNGDAYPDLYVANDFEDPDCLYRNNGNGTFSEVTRDLLPHTTWFSMGTDIADIDNDGRMDLLSLDMAGTSHYVSKTTMGAMGASKHFMQTAEPPQHMRNCLYLNTGTDRFVDVAYMAGLAHSDWSWTAKFADFDEDGRSDLFVSNGVTRSFNDSDKPLDVTRLIGRTEWDLYEDTPPRLERNLAFLNQGNLSFAERSKSWGVNLSSMSYGAAVGDLDRDGDLDLVVANLESQPFIHENLSSEGTRSLFRLSAADANTGAIGATVTAKTRAGLQIRQYHPSRGFLSSDEPIVHFGFGDEETIEELEVVWPSGNVDRFEDLPAQSVWLVKERDQGPDALPAAIGSRLRKTKYRRSDAIGEITHWERPFDDFQAQPLLPNRLSRLGPGLASADVDGDGDHDHFLGGAAGQPGRLLLNQGDGRFESRAFAPGDAENEDLGCLFLDVDGDGDSDLLIASGSVEYPLGHPFYRDRLYLNDGHGDFAPAPVEALPDYRGNSGALTAADFDRDGDLDLFVGGRSVPGKFPETPRSQLWRNDSRPGTVRFATVDNPDVQSAGLVTGAIWSDIDADGWPDLLLSIEWGPIRVFRNREGRLEDHTQESGLAELTGWWNGIAGGDFDNDGDFDFLIANYGLNTKYRASPAAPELLYYGVFGQNRTKRILEACYEGNKLFPHRGFSCSRNAIPSLGPQLGSYHNFALATLPELYTENRLSGADRYEAVELRTGLLLNDGQGRFAWRPLPRRAQTAPTFGAVTIDADTDGNPDLYLAQNFFSPQLETRPLDGGLSLLLLGDGTGRFTPEPVAESGLKVTGDAKSLIVSDLDGDLRPDFLIGLNDGPLTGFERRPDASQTWLAIGLRGLPGNPDGIGARLEIRSTNGAVDRTEEIRAGGGYLSQSPSLIWLGLPAEATELEAEVHWPQGTVSRHSLPARSGTIQLSHPARQ